MIRKLLFLTLAFFLPTLTFAGQGMGPGPGFKTYSAASSGISDDFSADTSANYTAITGTINIAAGTIGGDSNWQYNYFYNKTATGSNDHFVQADLAPSEATSAGGALLLLRSDGTTGYIVNVTSGVERIYLRRFNGGTVTDIDWISTIDAIANQVYRVKVSVSGSTFSFYIDHNSDGDFDDANESLGTKTDATYSTGQYIGIGANRGADGVDYRGDNLSGDAL